MLPSGKLHPKENLPGHVVRKETGILKMLLNAAPVDANHMAYLQMLSIHIHVLKVLRLSAKESAYLYLTQYFPCLFQQGNTLIFGETQFGKVC